MKKRYFIIACIVLLLALFVPIPQKSYDDGGTREYIALTYKIVDWNVLSDDGVYEKTRVYFGEDKYKNLDFLWLEESENVDHRFRATIIEINQDSVIVEPLETEVERTSSNKIHVDTGNLEKLEIEVGTVVDITYRGNVMEIYPSKVFAIKWEQAFDLRHLEFTEDWLDADTAEKYDNNIFSDIVITSIYKNCFFATPVIPTPYQIKLNGYIGDEWCVGDKIKCTYENTYYDEKNHRVEADLISVAVSDFKPDPFACYKPVIYLYPEKETEVNVTLDLNGELTCTYPAYENGWNVIASPDGTLTDKSGKIYNYLYWEGDTYAEYDFSKGFCVKGEDTASFLEYALERLGLTRREANEFIVYWLPLMQNNEYNVITFQTKAYTDSARLSVTPSPDTLIRVFMAFKASPEFVEIDNQTLTAPERMGFTVVEWGGCEIK